VINITPELHALIPALSEDELNTLEASILSDGIRDPIILWDNTIVDGHNRYEIAKRHGIDCPSVSRDFQSIDDAKIWMINNQNGRRNLTDGWKYELAQVKKKILLERGRTSMATSTGGSAPRPLSITDKPREDAHNTQKEIASDLGWSNGKTAQADYVWNHGDDEIKEKVKAGDVSINQAYTETRRSEKKEEQVKRFDELSEKECLAPTGKYDVIVIDPPWPMNKIDRDVAPSQTGFDYPTMNEDDIAAIDIPADKDCHMFLWTTHKFLPMSLRIIERWNFKYTLTMVWHKSGGFQPFGLPQYNCEFCIYARKGNPRFVDTKAFPTCFNAPRGRHSEKPDEFFSMIERVTAGQRLSMFERKERKGFDSWGNES